MSKKQNGLFRAVSPVIRGDITTLEFTPAGSSPDKGYAWSELPPTTRSQITVVKLLGNAVITDVDRFRAGISQEQDLVYGGLQGVSVARRGNFFRWSRGIPLAELEFVELRPGVGWSIENTTADTVYGAFIKTPLPRELTPVEATTALAAADLTMATPLDARVG